MPVCREGSCGEEIIWAKTRSGAMIPLNPEPSAAGNVVLETDGRCYVLPKGDDERYIGDKYVPHWKTCTNPKRFRKGVQRVDNQSTPAVE